MPELQGEPEDISKEKARLAALQVHKLLPFSTFGWNSQLYLLQLTTKSSCLCLYVRFVGIIVCYLCTVAFFLPYAKCVLISE